MNTRILAPLLCLVLSVSAFSRSARAQGANAANSPVDEARVARLVALARVWGVVKYFHPTLAYREIDWDKALVEAIPRVNAAKTAQDYQAAMNQMLVVLNDRSTRAEFETPIQANPAPPDPSKLVRTENGVLIIDAAQIAKAAAQNTSLLGGFITSINQALANATGIVFDWRAASQFSEFEAYYFDLLMRQTLTGMLDSTVVLGSSRHRLHNGYPTQTATGFSYYYSGLTSMAPQTIDGRGKSKTPPIVFIISQNSPALAEIPSGLQAANRALIIQEDDQPQDFSSGTYTIDLPDKVKVRIRTVELMNPDGSIDLQPDAIVQKSTTDDAPMKEALRALHENRMGQKRSRLAAPLLQVNQKDKPYSEMQFPTVEYRLLALFRFWNVINYFYPYKHLIADSWETVLPRFIPKFEANKDATDYQLTVMELATETHDTHTGVRNATAAAAKLFGFYAPVFISYLENQSVVTRVLDDKAPVKIGDVVLAIDGEPVEKRREFLSRYIAASTPQSLMLRVNPLLLAGRKDSVVKLRLRGVDRKEREVELTRSVAPNDRRFWARDRKDPIMKLLPEGYGYVDLGRLEVGEVDKMFEMIKDAPAVVFDIRGYPTGSAWEIAPRLTEKKNVVASLFSRALVEPAALTSYENAGIASYSAAQRLPEAKGSVYKGKVVMLINEEAISRAEHACLFFEAATDVTFIGTPTQGANGDVTLMVLPGNLPVSFSGHDIRHADGRQLQRLGIQPHITVSPTIRGLIEGRDEIFEAAIKHLQKTLKKKS